MMIALLRQYISLNTEFVTIPTNEAKARYHLAWRGLLKELQDQLFQLDSLGLEYQPFLFQLKGLAHWYRGQDIETLLKPFVEDE